MADYLLQVISIFSLVASIIVGFYAFAYSLSLWVESKEGRARKDWKTSVLFYAGIVLMVVGNVLNAVNDLYPFSASHITPLVYLIGLLFFFWGFRERMKQEERKEEKEFAETKSKRRPRRR